MNSRAQIGIVGLATMGRNLCINLLNNGHRVAAWNLENEEAERFSKEVADPALRVCASLKEMIQQLESPRQILLLIQAGKPVDDVIGVCARYLDAGDVLIDAGNSHYLDSERRSLELSERHIEFVGLGVSGGAEGARLGPSLMFGGSVSAWDRSRDVLESIVAKSQYGSCLYHFGAGGSGHFVKMVHNGIEYAEMQLIAETYDLMSRGLGIRDSELSRIFKRFNEGHLNSFLIELTSQLLLSESMSIDEILDVAEQKGTGRWVLEAGAKLGIPLPTIAASVDARSLSGLKERRSDFSTKIEEDREITVKVSPEEVESALLFGKICAFFQGVELVQKAKETYQWSLKTDDIPRCWRAGCILRGGLLDRWIEGIESDEGSSLLELPFFWEELRANLAGIRAVVGSCVKSGIPVPALSSSLAWFDSLTSKRLPQGLIQAQRDAFGGHGVRLIKEPTRLQNIDW